MERACGGASVGEDAGMTPDLDAFQDALTTAVAPWNLALTAEQVRRMAEHYAAMVEANKSFNLTRITDPVEAAVKHYADSLALVAWANTEKVEIRRLLDIGTGAGFPAVPLAIARPNWQVTAIDGTRKKVDFVAKAAAELGLTNLTTVHAHSDHWETKERFDVVAARAMGSIEECLKAARRFVARGGWVALFRTFTEMQSLMADRSGASRRRRGERASSFSYRLLVQGELLQRVIAVL